MKTSNYHEFTLKKIKYTFFQKKILNNIYILDEDKDYVDNVVFFKISQNDTIGIYINGSNPQFTQNNISEFDDFNLYSLYDVLLEERGCDIVDFHINKIRVVFNSDFNELLCIHFFDKNINFYIIFQQDEILVSELSESEANITHELKKYLKQYNESNFLIFEVTTQNPNWIEL